MDDPLERFFSNFIKRPGASEEDVARACRTLNFTPPSDYLDVLHFSNGGEGFIQRCYFRLYSAEQLLSLNEAYQVGKFAPGLVIFGSNGGGEAFGFDGRQSPMEIVRIPFIPMDFEYAEPMGQTFVEFLQALGQADQGLGSPKLDRRRIGKEVHELQPIVFGGNPRDAKNKALVPLVQHAELAVFWNSKYRDQKASKESR